MSTPQPLKRILPIDEPLDISRDQMTMLMMESFKKSSTSTEEILCLKEVAKLNSLYDVTPQSVTLINIQQNQDKLEVMTDDELLKLAGNNTQMFERLPPPKHKSKGKKIKRKENDKVIEAEFKELGNDESKGVSCE